MTYILRWLTKRILTVGIDIDANTIKLVALKKRSALADAFELVSYAHITTTPEFPSVSGAVKNALQQAGVNRKSKVVVALPYGQVLAKRIRLDKDYNTSLELENNIISHCQQIVSYPIHEACIDFEVIGASENNSPGADVRVVIARREAVEEKANLFSESDFSIAAVDLESDALARCVYYVLNRDKESDKQKIYIAIHVAAQKILGLVLCMGEIVFAQEIVISVTNPSGIKSQDYLDKIKILIPILDLAAADFLKKRKSIVYMAETVYLSGNQFFVEEFKSSVDRMILRKTCLINPFHGMHKGDGISVRDLEKHTYSLVISCGLAMRDFRNGN